MANELQEQNVKFSVAIQGKGYQNLINSTLQDPATRQRFVASIVSAVSVSPALQECTPKTILSGALLGESLKLSPSPQLGQYYLVPFKDKRHDVMNAAFVLGYKGMIQLAIRSGNYKRINVLAIKKGENPQFNPLTEDFTVNIMTDEIAREAAETIGYYAEFEYLNGFRKAMYWSREKMQLHADRYSPAYSRAAHNRIIAGDIPDKDMWKYSSFWYKDFDMMACKTMLRQLISHWGVMSVEMQTAYVSDEQVINDDLTPNYIDLSDIEDTRQDINRDVIESTAQGVPDPNELTDDEKAAIIASEQAEEPQIGVEW